MACAENMSQQQQVQLQWQNVSYSVKKPRSWTNYCRGKVVETVNVLDDVSGLVQPGQMLAILGPSGSGKTTLLNVLSGKLAGCYTGQVLVNGTAVAAAAAAAATKPLMRALARFVPQEDVLLDTQTVRETLEFYAHLALPLSGSSGDDGDINKRIVVNDMLAEVNLTHVQHHLVGATGADSAASGAARGLSGGERKRLAIACQLIAKPLLVFLDEPTTGLDSNASESVVRLLHKLTRQNKTVIMTIHQPSASVLQLFDQVVIFGRGGRTLYFGECAQMLDYFAKLGFNCPMWQNPGDYILEIAQGQESAVDILVQSYVANNNNNTLPANNNHYTLACPSSTLPPPPPPPPSFWRELRQLWLQQSRHLYRQPTATLVNIAQIALIALLVGWIFFGLGHTNTDLANRTGVLFYGINFLCFGALLRPFFNFGAERKLFLVQYQDGLYDTLSFYASRVLADAPIATTHTVIWCICVYWMCGLRDGAGPFFVYFALTWLLINASFAYGMLLVTAIPNTQLALQLFGVIFAPIVTFSGYYLNIGNTPPYFVWIEYLSYVKWIFQGVMLNEFTDVVFECTSTEMVTTTTINGTTSTTCAFTNGNQWLDYYFMRDFTVYGDALIALEFLILFHLAAFLLLQRSARTSTM